jgi:hypothetical protein
VCESEHIGQVNRRKYAAYLTNDDEPTHYYCA